MNPNSVRRSESRFRGPGRHMLLRRAWLPPEPERVIVLVHGFAEHSGRYDHVGEWFAKRGCAVHAYDQRGHGGSTGRRGHTDRFDDLLDDLASFLRVVRNEHAGTAISLVGHSMGGLVVAAFVRERQAELLAVVTSGAALELAGDVSHARLVVARLLRRLVPRLALSAGLDAKGLSRDPGVVRRYLEDPLVFSRMTVCMAVETVAAMKRTRDGGAAVRVPVLLLHGQEDSICPPSGSRAFWDSLGVDQRELRIYPGLRHEIFNEPEREEVFSELLEWLRFRESRAN